MFQFLIPMLATMGKAAAMGGKVAAAGGKAAMAGGKMLGSAAKPMFSGGMPLQGSAQASAGGKAKMAMDFLGSMMGQGGGMPKGGQQQAMPEYDISQAFALDPYQYNPYQLPQGGGMAMPEFMPLSNKKGRYY